MTHQNLLVELFVEELPPKALKKLGESFANVLFEQLRDAGLTAASSVVTAYASPRRLAAHVTQVAAQAADKAVQQKLMPVAVGLDVNGNASPALLKKLQALGADVSNPAAVVASLKRAPDGKAEALFYDSVAKGASLLQGLQKALDEALAKLPIPKVMTYQLETDCEMPGWTSVNFVRPAHGLVALHGKEVVPVKTLGLKAGQQTHGHRFEAKVSPVVIQDADSYADTLARDGAVIASFAERRAEIVKQLNAAAAKVGGGAKAIEDDALLDEVTALVERPNVLTCEFETQFLEVPQECLILTMKANQKYFPLLTAEGKLTHKFLVVSNISPADASAVIGGNERVVRPRLADAKFFFDQDRKKTLASRVEGLNKVVYHNKLGTQGERMARVRGIAKALGQALGGDNLAQAADTAAQLAKTDLLTDMVGEFPELQGIMGGYYARHDGLSNDIADAIEDHYRPRFAGDELPRNNVGLVGEFPELQGIMGGYYARHDGLSNDIADAIEDHYRPRFAGDELPRNNVGLVVALADKLETLVGMFGIGNLPSGDKDPFALRRHALGVIRMLMEKDLALDWRQLLALSVPVFGDKITDPSEALTTFLFDRLAGALREQGYSAQEVDAVLALHPARLGQVPKLLAAVRAFAALPESPALAAANKRIGNILKKADEVDPHVNPALLKESAEQALHEVMQRLLPESEALYKAGDYTGSLQTLAALRSPVDAFFDDVMVNAEEMDVRLNRQGLLKCLHVAMNRVADLSRLA